MKITLQNIFLALSLLAFAKGAEAQTFPNFGGQRAGLSTLSFLKNDVNPRSMAMGGASVALSGDGFSSLTNPAGLMELKGLNFSASNMFLGAGLKQAFLAGNYVTKRNSVFALSVNNLFSGPMEVRTEFQPNGTGEYFYANNLAVGATYAKKLSDMFSMGITLKYINERLADYKNHTAAADLGFLYKTDFKDLKFAVAVQNFGGNSSLKGDFLPVTFNRDKNNIPLGEYTVPTIFKMGLSIVPYKKDNHAILASVELDHPNDNAENYRIGAEYQFKELLTVRAGYQFNVAGMKLPTFGFGLRARTGAHYINISYAARPTQYMGMQHLLGLSFNLTKASSENE